MLRSLVLSLLICQAPTGTMGVQSASMRGMRVHSVYERLAASNGITSFEDFVEKHGRTYQPGTAEYKQRFALFEASLNEVVQHNLKINRRWTASINKFADRTPEEMQELRGWNGAVRPAGLAPSILAQASSSNATDDAENWWFNDMKDDTAKIQPKIPRLDKAEASLPKCVSWTFLESMQKENIQNQLACGSCWAFAASKALQAHSEIYQKRRTFSVEQIVSCTKNPQHCGGDGGCQGATSELAFEYVLGAGAETDSQIPYTGRDEVCKTEKYHDNGPYSSSLLLHDGSEMHAIHDTTKAKAGGAALGMTGWMKLKENSLFAVKNALVQHGPIAVGVSAAYGWNMYSSGILGADECPKDAIIDHAVTLVGYGEDGSDKYWHILNSWGPDWGEGGFIRLTMTDSEQTYCGIDDKPEVGTACEGESDPVTVCGMCGVLYDTSVPLFAGDGSAAKKKALAGCA